MSVQTDIANVVVKIGEIPDGTSRAVFDRIPSNGKVVFMPEVGDTYYMYKGPYQESEPILRTLVDTWMFIKGFSLPDSTSFDVVVDTQNRYWLRFIRPKQFRKKFDTKFSNGYSIPSNIKPLSYQQLEQVLFTIVVFYFLNLFPFMIADDNGHIYLIDLLTLTPQYTLENLFGNYPGFYQHHKETIDKYTRGINPRIDAFAQAGYADPANRMISRTTNMKAL